jgi:DNA polymerase
MRQAGKVAVLALGFLGGVGALKAMARGYGMRLTNEEAKVIVDGWRDRNRWARRFGDKCEEAAFAAMSTPGRPFKAGRLTYEFFPGLMGGTLVCFLPDRRPIVYPAAKIVKMEKFGKDVDTITYLNGMGRRGLWNGLQVENGTQATAASILRGTLVRLETEQDIAELVGHTHDEVITEAPEDKAEAFAKQLEAAMVRGFDWTEGLPLAAEVEVDYYYHK